MLDSVSSYRPPGRASLGIKPDRPRHRERAGSRAATPTPEAARWRPLRVRSSIPPGGACLQGHRLLAGGLGRLRIGGYRPREGERRLVRGRPEALLVSSCALDRGSRAAGARRPISARLAAST